MSCEPRNIVVISVTLTGRYDACKSITVWLSTDSITGETVDEQPPMAYFPIIKSISDIGIQMDEFYPKGISGSVTLDNTRHSAGSFSRFTDLACEYELQGACAVVFVACTCPDSDVFLSKREMIFQGEIDQVNYQTDGTEKGQTCTFTIKRLEPEFTLTKQLTYDEFGATLPEQSRNQYLPIVFGLNQQVQPHPLTDGKGQSSGWAWAYATNMESGYSPRFRNGGISKILVADLESTRTTRGKDREKIYREVQSANYAVPVFVTGTGAATGNINTPNRAHAFPIPYTPGVTTPYLLTGGRIWLKGNGGGAGTRTGELAIKVHAQKHDAQRPTNSSETLGDATIERKYYSTNYASGTGFWAVFTFREPIPIVSPTKGYWLAIQAGGEDVAANRTDIPTYAFAAGTPGGAVSFKTTDDTSRDEQDTWVENGNQTAKFELFAMEFLDSPNGTLTADRDGLGYSYVTTRYNDFLGATTHGAYELEEPAKLDFILEINGLRDSDNSLPNAAGGQAYPISPDSQAAVLLHRWIGDRWIKGLFDDTLSFNTHLQYYLPYDYAFFRQTQGRTFNRATNLEILRDICRSGYSQIYYNFGGGAVYGLNAPGIEKEPVAFLTDNDFRLARWFENGNQNIINNVQINYLRRLDGYHTQNDADQVDFKDYAATFRAGWNSPNTYYQQISAYSQRRFGDKRLSDEGFDWIGDARSAGSVAELYLRLHDFPYQYAWLRLPYCNTDLKMFDVITISSTELPNCSGTNPAVMVDETSCGIVGSELIIARTLRGEIVGMTLSARDGEPVILDILLRLCVHEHDPLWNYSGGV